MKSYKVLAWKRPSPSGIADQFQSSNSSVRALVIKDEAIPTLLRRVDQTTFVTINHTDFWRRIPAERAFCLVCFRLSADQAQEIPDLLRRLLRLPEFRTKRERMGKVALISRRGIQYYSHRDKLIHILGWGQ
jgi:hypothetical protein